MFQQSFNNKATMFLVSTPIGNMGDITVRAIEILREVSAIFSEDTRNSKKLCKYHEIKAPLFAAYDQNESKIAKKMITYLENGNNIALISDAGTPLINDPGYKIVQEVLKEQYNVVAIPGATAFVPALITSGIAPYPFIFYGFLSNKKEKRKKELKKLIKNKETIIFYEAPHRIEKMLKDVLELFGNRKIAVAREISKKFEEIYRGNISGYLESEKKIKGEYVIVVEGFIEKVDIKSSKEIIEKYLQEGLSKKEAVKKAASELSVSKNKLYNEYHSEEV